jgi:ferredoxin--NADP+ reductase
MTHVITTLCIRDGACVEVCPVECIVPGPKDNPEWQLFYIDPDTCIDCGACVPACPVEAIFPEEDLPGQYAAETKLNADFFTNGPGYWEYDLEEQRVHQ